MHAFKASACVRLHTFQHPPCGPGRYQDETGQTACKACPGGSYHEKIGSQSVSACVPAPKGNYAAGAANEGCFTRVGIYASGQYIHICTTCVRTLM